MLSAFAERGVVVVGFDRSPRMVELARERLAGRGTVELADMTDFDLGRTLDGAVCPINTLLHLTPEPLARHRRTGRGSRGPTQSIFSLVSAMA